jgi:hypothetical protein
MNTFYQSPTLTSPFAGETKQAFNQKPNNTMATLFTFFLQVTRILVGMFCCEAGLETKNQYSKVLLFKFLRIEKTNVLVKYIWLPTQTKTLIYSGNSPGKTG